MSRKEKNNLRISVLKSNGHVARGLRFLLEPGSSLIEVPIEFGDYTL